MQLAGLAAFLLLSSFRRTNSLGELQEERGDARMGCYPLSLLLFDFVRPDLLPQ